MISEIERDLMRENAAKKRNAVSARKKKNGSRSKKCSLPSDRLTKKQREKLNSEVITYSMNERKTWSDFKQMPKDLQKEYLKSLVEIHGGRQIDVAKMFGVQQASLSNYCRRSLAGFNPWAGKIVRHTQSPSWKAFIGGNDEQNTNRATKTSFKIESGTMRFVGKPSEAFEAMMLILDNSKTYRISVEFSDGDKTTPINCEEAEKD